MWTNENHHSTMFLKNTDKSVRISIQKSYQNGYFRVLDRLKWVIVSNDQHCRSIFLPPLIAIHSKKNNIFARTFVFININENISH